MGSKENSHMPPFHMKNRVIPLGETLYFELVLSKHLVEHVGPEEQCPKCFIAKELGGV